MTLGVVIPITSANTKELSLTGHCYTHATQTHAHNPGLQERLNKF